MSGEELVESAAPEIPVAELRAVDRMDLRVRQHVPDALDVHHEQLVAWTEGVDESKSARSTPCWGTACRAEP